jgi:parallel beta-helix repeat protein
MLVENNTAYGNGSSGIESFGTNNAVITGNTAYGNDTENVQTASNAQIFINQSSNDTVTNNTTTAPNLTPPGAPTISGDTVNGFAPATVTLNGTAEAGSTVTAYDNSTKLGTTVTNTSGVWTFTTGGLANGSQSFTATATDSVGNVSPLSSPLVVTLNQPANLIANGNFATGDFTDWTLGGNDGSGQIFIDANARGGSTYAAGMGSIGANGTLSQTIATTPGQTYTLSFWLQDEGSGGNDFQTIWNGQELLSLTNSAQFNYTEYTYTVTATSSTTSLEFSAANGPSQWDLDNISLAANGKSPATTLTSIMESPSSGDLNVGKTVAWTLGFRAAVTVAGGTPTLTLNDGGIATYSGGSGTNALTFSYAVAVGQNTSALAATALHLNSASITDGAGNAANVSLTGLPQSGPQIDTTPPPVPIITFDKVMGKRVVLNGTEAQTGTRISIYDGTTLLGTTTTGTKGTWTYTTGPLANGTHIFTATATDAAGNVSAASSPYDPNLGAPSLNVITLANADLAHVGIGVKSTLGYSANSNNTGGALTVNEGTHMATLALLGQYIAGSFVAASDSHGGTLVSEQALSLPQTPLLTHPHA